MKRLFMLLIVSLVVLCSTIAQAVTVAWDDTNPVGSITEFRLYYSTTPGGGTSYIRIAPVTLRTYVVPDSYFTTMTTYMRMTAYDSVRVSESLPSTEIVYIKTTTSTTSIKPTTTTTSVKPTTTTTSVLPLTKPFNLKIVATTTVP